MIKDKRNKLILKESRDKYEIPIMGTEKYTTNLNYVM